MQGRLVLVLCAFAAMAGCGGNADDIGVGAECATNDDCPDRSDFVISCLTAFRGGYCGVQGCTVHADCPEDSFCVAHTDGNDYCFRTCTDKAECNANRSADNESNCSSNITPTEPSTSKACVPPSA